MNKTRLNSISIVGGAFGDEGKGKVVDEITNKLVNRFGNAIVYRWSGGSNAGHTVEIQNKKIVLHQIPSGAMVEGALCVLGKGMVLHPGDLVEEIKSISEGKRSLNIMIDEMATLCLDTHRAFETMLKKREEGWGASTGRGISPAYADILYRTPLKGRDLLSKDWKAKFEKHYLLYKDFVKGLGGELSKIEVNSLHGPVAVGNINDFIKKLSNERDFLFTSIKNVYDFIKDNWNSKTPFIFEGAQGVGLDYRWGVYPDITAADPTPSGIFASTEGIIASEEIEIRANVYKATYMSSVGKRILPSKMESNLVERIRNDANEYGATTGRPRDIYHVDIPALAYYARVTNATHMILTHMDVCYKDLEFKICVNYKNKSGTIVDYRPDQKFLDKIMPIYQEISAWNGNDIKNVADFNLVPDKAKKYIQYLSDKLKLKCLMITTGPERDSVIENNCLLL